MRFVWRQKSLLSRMTKGVTFCNLSNVCCSSNFAAIFLQPSLRSQGKNAAVLESALDLNFSLNIQTEVCTLQIRSAANIYGMETSRGHFKTGNLVDIF